MTKKKTRGTRGDTVVSVSNPAASVGSSHATFALQRSHNSEEQRATSVFRVMESILYPGTFCPAQQIFFG